MCIEVFTFEWSRVIYIQRLLHIKFSMYEWFRNQIWWWLRVGSHHTWGYVTMLYCFGGVLGRPLDTFSWALTISRSRLLARVWSDPTFINCGLWRKDVNGSVPKLQCRQLGVALNGFHVPKWRSLLRGLYLDAQAPQRSSLLKFGASFEHPI